MEKKLEILKLSIPAIMPVSCWEETDTVLKKNPLITDGNFLK